MKPTAGDIDTITGVPQPVVLKGLPAPDDVLSDASMGPDGVAARSEHPDNRISHCDAFNALLPRLIDSLDIEFERFAMRVIFSIEPGTSGITLTARRAAQLGSLNTSTASESGESREWLTTWTLD